MCKLEKEHQNVDYFFIFSTKWVEKTDFGKFITTLLSEIENLL